VTEAHDQAEEQASKGSHNRSAATGGGTNPYTPNSDEGTAEAAEMEPEVGKCAIWVGDSGLRGNTARMDKVDEGAVIERDGPGLVYLPLVPGNGLRDPSELWSTWKFDYRQEQTEQLMKLSEVRYHIAFSLSCAGVRRSDEANFVNVCRFRGVAG